MSGKPVEHEAEAYATTEVAWAGHLPHAASPGALSDTVPPLVADTYEVRSRLGSGGMGEVYAVVHRTLRAELALKVLRPEHRRDPSIVTRFRAEGRALWELAHPGFVRVHHAGDDPAVGPFLVLERLVGRSLADVIEAAGRLAPDDAIRVGCAVAEAAHAMHALGMIHRDLKPSNVFLTRGEGGARGVKLLDLGAAKIPKYGDPPTAPGHALGTLRYMSPEQLRAEPVGPAADVYALGHVLFESIAGRHAFGAHRDEPTRPAEIVAWHRGPPPPRLDALVPGVSPRLAALVASALAPEASQRPASMAIVAAQLAALLGRAT
jgi:serine/threonine-protein kinase